MYTMLKRLKFLLLITGLVVWGYWQSSYAVVHQGPLEQMKAAVDEILFIMRGEQFSQPELRAGEKKRIVAILERHFDFEEMSMRTLARHWKSRTTSEKKYFVELFSKLLKNTYVDRVDSYSGEELVFTKEEIKGRYAMVYSNFIRNNVEIPVYYRLKNSEGNWKVYDVIIEGVSLVRNYRTQFQSILERQNYAELIKKMEEKIVTQKESQGNQ